MLKVNDLPPEEMNEAIRLADEMYRKESEANRERTAAVQAAGELGIPESYLDRAAQEIHARRVERIQQTRRRNRRLGAAILGLAVGILIALSAANLRPMKVEPVQIATSGAGPRVNPGTVARIASTNTSATIEVERFVPDSQGHYFANAELSPPPGGLEGYRQVSFTVQGTGTLSSIRLDFEQGDTRWRSRNIGVSPQPQTVSLSIREFERQSRIGQDQWRTRGFRYPEKVKKITFKVGETVNPAEAQGSVTIDNLTFR